MPVIEYIEHDTAPLPLGPEMQALAQDRQEVGEDGTQPEPSDIAKAIAKTAKSPQRCP